MSEEIKIITLGDIFKNIETEEKAFKFKDYIKHLQQKVEQLEKENEYLKMSNPEQNMEHFRIVNENKRKIDMLRKENHQLENIRKEAVDYMKENCDIITIDRGWIIRSELTTTGLGKLFKILNKGE